MTTTSTHTSRSSGARLVIGLLLAAVALAAFGVFYVRWRARPAPFGIAQRVGWTGGKVSGSPEPPDPYLTQRAYPKLTFDHPLDLTFTPDGTRAFVLQQKSRLYSFRNDPGVDHADLVLDLNQVQGLDKIANCRGAGDSYGVILHPKFNENHYCYICYTLDFKPPYTRNHDDASRVSRFIVSSTDPPTIDPKSEQILFTWISGGHNGGCIKFGPDGYLYISTGDGGDPNPPDPFGTGQDIGDVLSSVLRIDVDHPDPGKSYSIPPDNPFVHTPGARGEVWCYGLRNPWRMNFDRQTGNLWIGDVGWELWESVDCAKPGGNYGWSIMEGPNPVHPNGKRGPTPISKPQAEISHSEAASLTGGVVYRGKKIPGLNGYYLFGDWQTSRLWAARCNADTLEPFKTIAQTDQRIVCFAEDPEGEPVIVDHIGGGLWHIAANPDVNRATTFPRKLTETGLFTSVKDQAPASGVLPFEINAPQWVDGAIAQRFVAFPGSQSMTWGKGPWGDDKPAWPKDSVLVRTLSLPMRAGDSSSSRKVETQLLHFDGRQWQAYSYAWNDDQSDAELQPSGGADKTFTIADTAVEGGTRRQIWHYASRSQCMTCHNVWCDYTLAFNLPQLDRVEKFSRPDGRQVADNQVRTFRHLGLLIEPKPPEPPKPRDPSEPPPPVPEVVALSNPYDASADVYERARSYLHVNCSVCHRFGGGGAALIDLRKEMKLDQMKVVDQRPLLGDFGIDDPRIVFAGDPSRSVLLYRTCKLGRGRMPHIGSDLVDDLGTALLRQWIERLTNLTGTPAVGSATLERRAAQQQNVGVLESNHSSAGASAAADSLLDSTSGGLQAVGLLQSASLPQAARQAILAKGIASPREAVHDLFRRFDPKEQLAEHLSGAFDRAKLLSTPGDATRGKAVFYEVSAGLCSRCHRVNGQGADFGPDLSHIAAKYDKAALLENIVEPSKTIAEGFTSYLVKTKSGDVFNGLLVTKDDAGVVLKDTSKQYRIASADIEKMVPQTISAMPEGLLNDLSPTQAADLLEYLATLK